MIEAAAVLIKHYFLHDLIPRSFLQNHCIFLVAEKMISNIVYPYFAGLSNPILHSLTADSISVIIKNNSKCPQKAYRIARMSVLSGRHAAWTLPLATKGACLMLSAEHLPNGLTLTGRPFFKLGQDSVLLSAFARIPKRARVLDLGCGTGALAPAMLAR